MGVLVRALVLAGRRGVFGFSSVLSGSVVGQSAVGCLGACTVGCGDSLAGPCWLLAHGCLLKLAFSDGSRKCGEMTSGRLIPDSFVIQSCKFVFE